MTGYSRYVLMRVICVILPVVYLLAVSPVLHANEPGEIRIADTRAWSDEDGVYLDAQFIIQLSIGAREALENGVPLTFELQMQIVKTHTWFWDTVEVERILYRQLQYHALSQSYLVRDVETGTQGNYSRLGDALAAVGMTGELLMTDQPLVQESTYIARLRGSHDIESLPTPVRLLAYVSSEWDMGSEWYTWPLNR